MYLLCIVVAFLLCSIQTMYPTNTTNTYDQEKIWSNSLALEEEKILFLQRKHWFVLLPVVLSIILGLILSFIALDYISVQFSVGILTSLVLVLSLLTLSASLLIKSLTEWYFTVYILTSRRLLEICYTPLASYFLNNVLLEQVRCTEIDTATSGWLYKYLNIGDIIVTFDRPTHRDAFILQSIKNFHLLSRQLCGLLLPIQVKQQRVLQSRAISNIPAKVIWFKQKNPKRKLNPFEEITSRNNILNYPVIKYGL